MLSKQQEIDSKECEEASGNGTDMECMGCSCSVCIAHNSEDNREEIRQLKYTIRSLTKDLIKEKELRKKLEEFIDCSRSSFFKK